MQQSNGVNGGGKYNRFMRFEQIKEVPNKVICAATLSSFTCYLYNFLLSQTYTVKQIVT